MGLVFLKFKLDERERERWQFQADSCEMTLSDWVRDCCNGRIDPSLCSLPIEQFKRSLSVSQSGRKYTGETAFMFGVTQYEYEVDGRLLWTREAP